MHTIPRAPPTPRLSPLSFAGPSSRALGLPFRFHLGIVRVKEGCQEAGEVPTLLGPFHRQMGRLLRLRIRPDSRGVPLGEELLAEPYNTEVTRREAVGRHAGVPALSPRVLALRTPGGAPQQRGRGPCPGRRPRAPRPRNIPRTTGSAPEVAAVGWGPGNHVTRRTSRGRADPRFASTQLWAPRIPSAGLPFTLRGGRPRASPGFRVGRWGPPLRRARGRRPHIVWPPI